MSHSFLTPPAASHRPVTGYHQGEGPLGPYIHTCMHSSPHCIDNKGAAVLRMLRAYLAYSQAPGGHANASSAAVATTVLDPTSGVLQLPMRRSLRQALRQGQARRQAQEAHQGRQWGKARRQAQQQQGQQRDPLLHALTVYLQQYKYQSVTYSDLWGSLSNSTGAWVWCMGCRVWGVGVDTPPPSSNVGCGDCFCPCGKSFPILENIDLSHPGTRTITPLIPSPLSLLPLPLMPCTSHMTYTVCRS